MPLRDFSLAALPRAQYLQVRCPGRRNLLIGRGGGSITMSKVKVGLLGTGFVADLHAAAFQTVPDAEVVAVASPTPGKAKHFAKERGIPHAFEDYRDLLKLRDINLVTLGIPNHLHARATLDAAAAGKHVV